MTVRYLVDGRNVTKRDPATSGRGQLGLVLAQLIDALAVAALVAERLRRRRVQRVRRGAAGGQRSQRSGRCDERAAGQRSAIC